VAFFKAKQCVESFNIYVFNAILVTLEISGTASQEEIPLINVDVVASAQNRRCVQERIQKFVFLEQSSANTEVESARNVLN